MKTWKIHMIIDDKGNPWLGTVGSTEKEAWIELEKAWGTNKKESKAEGFTAIICDIVPRERKIK